MFPAQHFSHAQACRSALHHRAAAAAAAVRQPSAAAAVAVPTHHRVCSFSFANSQRANKPTGRRNKHVVKREGDNCWLTLSLPEHCCHCSCSWLLFARPGSSSSYSHTFAGCPLPDRPVTVIVGAEGQLRNIAAGLCNFNGKQLQAVSHLLSAEHIKQVKIGMDIPPTNQVSSSSWGPLG